MEGLIGLFMEKILEMMKRPAAGANPSDRARPN
jgi:hypothetical protein